jgi:hypothetical protein
MIARFLLVEPTHLDSSSRLHGCSHFSIFVLGFSGVMLSVAPDVLVDSVAPMVTVNLEINRHTLLPKIFCEAF